MSSYRVRIMPTEDCNPEFYPDVREQDGFECDGYMIVTFVNGKVDMELMTGVSTGLLAEYMMQNSDGTAALRAAAAIAEGNRRGEAILRVNKERKHRETLMRIFGGIGDDDE